MENPRVSHNRFCDGEPLYRNKIYPDDIYHYKMNNSNKIVTVVWTLSDKNILTYGATVYTKDSGSDAWKKRDHYEKALQRFVECPIRVELVSEQTTNSELSSHSIDWFISEKLVFRFGTHNNDTINVRSIDGKATIRDDFIEKYDPFYQEMVINNFMTLYKPHYKDMLKDYIKTHKNPIILKDFMKLYKNQKYDNESSILRYDDEPSTCSTLVNSCITLALCVGVTVLYNSYL